MTPTHLFHATNAKKARQYHLSGEIRGPVRGFDTLLGAMAWAMKVGRRIIYRVECVNRPHLMPDHHNEFGKAWWTETVPLARIECWYSCDGPIAAADLQPR